MGIYYISNIRFPTEKAHGQQIAKMCEAFVDLEQEVSLIIPKRFNEIKETPEKYYDLRHTFPIVYLKVIDLYRFFWIPKILAFVLLEGSFILSLSWWLRKGKIKKDDIVITRDQYIIWFLGKKIKKLVFEIHDISKTFLKRYSLIAELTTIIISTNTWKKNYMISVWGDRIQDKILVLPNAVEIEPFLHLPSSEIVRNQLNLLQEDKMILYTGHLYQWKGVYNLANAAAFLPKGYKIVVVGGTKEDFLLFRNYLDQNGIVNVLLIPHVSRIELLNYLAAADCFVLPNTGTDWNSRFTTSPLKLWEYLAAKKPIIISDLPSMRELVSKKEVYFVEPDNPNALAEKIVFALAQDNDVRVGYGFEIAKKNSWIMRAQRILSVL